MRPEFSQFYAELIDFAKPKLQSQIHLLVSVPREEMKKMCSATVPDA